jgi:septum formation protein
MLLEAAGVDVDVRPSNVDETRDPANDPVTHAAALAARKAQVGPDDVVVLAADTVVHRDDEIFEKPADRDEARRHLRALSGGWHDVTTAVCVRNGARTATGRATTRVRFRTLTDADIERYLATGEADDKAGAYGIQGLGAALVAEVRGSYTNVIGLPVEETLELLREIGA